MTLRPLNRAASVRPTTLFNRLIDMFHHLNHHARIRVVKAPQIGGNDITRATWPYWFRQVAAFLFAPERWTRAQGLAFTPEVEQLRQDLLRRLYQFAGVPTVGLDGVGHRLPKALGLSAPTAPKVTRALADYMNARSVKGLAKHLASIDAKVAVSTRREERPILLLDLPLRHAADHVQLPGFKQAIGPILEVLEVAGRHQWRVCPLCARPFPAAKKARACPPCRRKWTRRQIQRRLPKPSHISLAFLTMPLSEPQSVRLCLAKDVDTPPAIRRMALAARLIPGAIERARERQLECGTRNDQ